MDRFSICQAYAQLESDYNIDGCLRERPSNQRRKESIGCQLSRMGFSNPYGWVDITDLDDTNGDCDADDIREIYMKKVLQWGLPIDAELMSRIKEFFVPEYVTKFPQCAHSDYLQGR